MNPMDRLQAHRAREERILLGLMSGMSLDGLDLALVRVIGAGPRPAVELIAGRTVPYDDSLKDRLRAAQHGDAATLARLDMDLGASWAASIAGLLRSSDVAADDIAVIGSHGQTVHHTPREDTTGAATLQIGQADVIADETGIPVVSDFRPRDIAAGGEGAPLIPLADWMLFGADDCVSACQNLGNIANVTVVTPALADVVAFDTGPANALIDAAARSTPDGRALGGIDRDGALSAAGRVDDDLLLALYTKRSPWIVAPPPKSAGYGTFGPGLFDEVGDTFQRLSLEDRVRTAVEYTAVVLRDAYAWHVVTHFPELEVVRLSGGGSENPTLVARISELLGGLDLDVERLPPPWSDLKEAVGFALLADRTLRGLPGNVPGATGAAREVVLGKLSLP